MRETDQRLLCITNSRPFAACSDISGPQEARNGETPGLLFPERSENVGVGVAVPLGGVQALLYQSGVALQFNVPVLKRNRERNWLLLLCVWCQRQSSRAQGGGKTGKNVGISGKLWGYYGRLCGYLGRLWREQGKLCNILGRLWGYLGSLL